MGLEARGGCCRPEVGSVKGKVVQTFKDEVVMMIRYNYADERTR